MPNGMASAGPGTSSAPEPSIPTGRSWTLTTSLRPGKSGFFEKEGGEDARMLSENSHDHLIRALEWSRDGAEVWIYGNEPLLK